MMFKHLLNSIIWILLLAGIFWGCNDPVLFENEKGELQLSTDTVAFDTVFTTIGSTTKTITVRNPFAKSLKISTIELTNKKSFFRLNIDGVASNKQSDLELHEHDSLYIFVEVNIDPNNQNNPILIEDSISITVNGKKSHVLLQAFGQDVNVVKGGRLMETEIWDSPKPYFLFDSITVLPNHTLTIEKGVSLYCYKNFKIQVLGNIVVNGTVDEPVVFRGHRLDEIWDKYKYDYTTGQWEGIYIFPSKKVSSFTNCLIKNAEIGLYIGDTDSEEITEVNLQNTIIHNNSFAGLYAINSRMKLKNCQITNSGVYNVFLIAGGDYNFYHCTILNFFGIDYNTQREETPCLSITNAVMDGEKPIFNPLKNANFYNCIVDGNLANEIVFQVMEDVEFNFKFNHCALKVHQTIKDNFNGRFPNCYFNDSIKYMKVEEWNYNFQPDTNSFAIDKGNIDYILNDPDIKADIFGKSRLKDGKPDLGAYEFEK